MLLTKSANPHGWRADIFTPALCDYIATDESLLFRREAATDYADPLPGSLFAHPVWLRAYGANDLVIVEPLKAGLPNLVFSCERGGLVHRGRLLRLDAELIAKLSKLLAMRTGCAFTVFEDVEVVGSMPSSPQRLAFHYQNNWRLNLHDTAWTSKQLVVSTKRKARGLQRDMTHVTIRFEPTPDHGVISKITIFGRARMKAQGRRYGIDAAEVDRLVTIAAEIGHGTLVRSGDTVLAADLICITGGRAYFLTHGYDPEYPRHRLGMVSLINSIEACVALGVSEMNLLWGDQPYKGQLGAERVPLRTVVVPSSWVAALHPSCVVTILHFGWLDLKRRLKPHLTRLRHRITTAT